MVLWQKKENKPSSNDKQDYKKYDCIFVTITFQMIKQGYKNIIAYLQQNIYDNEQDYTSIMTCLPQKYNCVHIHPRRENVFLHNIKS